MFSQLRAFLTAGFLSIPLTLAQSVPGVNNTAACNPSPDSAYTPSSASAKDAPVYCTWGPSGPYGAKASATGQMSIAGNTFSFTTAVLSSDYETIPQGARGSNVSASIKAGATLLVDGSGPGFAVINVNDYLDASDTSEEGGSDLSCTLRVGGVSVISTYNESCSSTSKPIPIQLGTLLTFSYSASTLVGNTAAYGGGSAQAGGSLSVSFYGADGVTPVQIEYPSILGAQSPLLFVPIPSCRVLDTRNSTETFGGPALSPGEIRSFPLSRGRCDIPASAYAYSLNATVVPNGALDYVTLWPSDKPLPSASILNSLDGRIKASAAIIPSAADGSGSISVYATDATNLILDINGYFVSDTGLLFHPLQPCRIVDTRQPDDGPLIANITRSFTVAGYCGVPAYGSVDTPAAYSLNITAIPRTAQLGYLTMWPAGSSIPLVSTLIAPTGVATANTAIVPGGLGGAISALVSDNTDLVIDVNGYFSPPNAGVSGGLFFFPVTPARILDTRAAGGVFSGTIQVDVLGANAGIPATAAAYVLNSTVIPVGGLDYLTLWRDGVPMPLASILNALDGAVTSNMAIVPAGTNGFLDAFASNNTDLLLDIAGYFR